MSQELLERYVSRYSQHIVELVSKLVAIETSTNIHENGCHDELPRSVSAAHDVLTKEAEKRKLVALPSKPILDMDSNSGHKSIVATIIGVVHTFHHALNNV